jgi:putative oxidoreductase
MSTVMQGASASTTTTTRTTSRADNTPADVAALVGRLLIAYLFVPAGFGKLMGFSGVVGYIASKGVPLPEVCAAISIAVELGLGLLLVVGWKARWAALGIALFTLAITPIFHNYWGVPDAQMAMQKLNFTKNLAIAGGLLAFAAFGAGRFSLDGRGRS